MARVGHRDARSAEMWTNVTMTRIRFRINKWLHACLWHQAETFIRFYPFLSVSPRDQKIKKQPSAFSTHRHFSVKYFTVSLTIAVFFWIISQWFNVSFENQHFFYGRRDSNWLQELLFKMLIWGFHKELTNIRMGLFLL